MKTIDVTPRKGPKKPFVELTVTEEASLAEVTLLSTGCFDSNGFPASCGGGL